MSVASPSLSMKNFWYVVCQSKDLKPNKTMARTLLDEWLVLFRDKNGQARAFHDRCIHRNFQLSKGWVKDGELQCGYHGWTFQGDGSLVGIPSEGLETKNFGKRCAKTFETKEQQGFIYVRLEKSETLDTEPFEMPKFKHKSFNTVRLFNKFKNSVINCVENYIDVPHTVFVHDKIFRKSLNQEITTQVVRKDGRVKIEYFGEDNNLGWFSWAINPKKKAVVHIDTYHMPNISCVQYIIGEKEFWITSQSVPISEYETWVWTDLTYNFFNGPLNDWIKPIVRFQGQKVIDQDIDVLGIQAKVIEKYGYNFSNSPADTIHVYIESIYNSILKGKNPLDLPVAEKEIKFWI